MSGPEGTRPGWVRPVSLVAAGLWLLCVVLSLGPLFALLRGAGVWLGPSVVLLAVAALMPLAIGALALRGAAAPAPARALEPDTAFPTDRRLQDLDRRLARMEARRVQPPAPVASAPIAAETPPELPLSPAARPVSDAPLSTGDLLMALNFPRDAQDTDGFAALERARADGRWADVLSAAEDVLNILSLEGIYADDLAATPVPASLWRGYARGARADLAAALPAEQNAQAVAQVIARSRSDGVFRDAQLHLLRRFEGVLADLAERLSDEDLEAAMETRSARAFLLLNRAGGALSQHSPQS